MMQKMLRVPNQISQTHHMHKYKQVTKFRYNNTCMVSGDALLIFFGGSGSGSCFDNTYHIIKGLNGEQKQILMQNVCNVRNLKHKNIIDTK